MTLSGFVRSGLHRISRLLFREGRYYRFRFGKLKGLRSYYRNGVNIRNLLGLYDKVSLELLMEVFSTFDLFDRPLVVADIGANMGYYSLFFARYCPKQSRIYSFEPSESILDVLKKNLAVNHCSNVTIVEAACSNKPGTTEFFIGQNNHTSSMLGSWAGNQESGTKTQVRTESIDHFFATGFPDLIKMDIEGAGVYALRGAGNCLASKRPLILMESHNAAEDAAVGDVLQQNNYEALRVNDNKWIIHKDRDFKDPDGVWGTMLLLPAEQKDRFLKNRK